MKKNLKTATVGAATVVMTAALYPFTFTAECIRQGNIRFTEDKPYQQRIMEITG